MEESSIIRKKGEKSCHLNDTEVLEMDKKSSPFYRCHAAASCIKFLTSSTLECSVMDEKVSAEKTSSSGDDLRKIINFFSLVKCC